MIRSANLLDVPWLLEQGRLFDEFTGEHLLPEDSEEAARIIEGLVTTLPFFIAADTNGRQGFIAGGFYTQPFNPDIVVLTELVWWVAPAHRGSFAGARLLKHFIDFGIEQGANLIEMKTEMKSPINPKSMERAGFREVERGWLYRVAA
jgi:N-acetylglutamate synthase-like GNAT family acetyltransferase